MLELEDRVRLLEEKVAALEELVRGIGRQDHVVGDLYGVQRLMQSPVPDGELGAGVAVTQPSDAMSD